MEMYKMLTGKYDKDSCIKFECVIYPGTRHMGINKIYQDHVHYNLRKYFFAVIPTWNSRLSVNTALAAVAVQIADTAGAVAVRQSSYLRTVIRTEWSAQHL